ncbi:MAG: patatin-like phospholipase family protein [Bryobacterales bacterium]|nr:patatin-like phospholipase family protein [Bryobacterales bacterium]
MKAPLNIADANNPVILEIMRRRKLIQNGEVLSEQPTKLGLVIEGGGMRGVISGGVLVAMERLGLTDVFDEVYGESAGAINACYFLAGQADFGASIYRDNLSSRKFVHPFRFGRILDLDYAIDQVVGKIKALDCEKVKRARSKLFVSLTNTQDGTGRIVDFQNENIPLLTLLKATAAIVPLYNKPVVIEGVAYADGGITDPVPVRNAVNSGCTHILVLLTREPSFVARGFTWLERIVVDRLLSGWNDSFVNAFYNVRWKRLNESRDIAFGRSGSNSKVEIGVICPSAGSPGVGRMSTDHRVLDRAMDESVKETLHLFGWRS